ncbi:MAG TPA: ABC transporter permease, partial [Candidatus Polarisedimenticolaceae bacterium]|nr:ABC transporter permease [Candidatus Polarisedimenticolaceae bacterium]
MEASSFRTHLEELYRYRVLVDSLSRREVRARYRGSVLGYLWTLLNPLLLLVVYVLVFTRFTRAVTIENYALFLLAGILPWQWLSTSITNGTTSILHGGGLITRVCMPPQILPAVVVLSNLAHFLLALPVLLAAAAAAGLWPTPAIALLPIAIANELVFLYGVSLIVATLTVRFRDVQFLVQNLLMVWFFLTPVAYPLDMVPERYRALVEANPATALVRPFQEILFEGRAP